MPEPEVTIPEGDWRHGLPEEMKSDKSIADFKLEEGEEGIKVPPTLVKSFINQQPLIGGDKIPRPKEGATAEEWSKFYESVLPGDDTPDDQRNVFLKTIGRPDDPTEYEFAISDEAKERIGDKVSERLEGWFRAKAHEIGLPKGIAEQLFGEYMNEEAAMLKEQSDADDAAYEACVNELRNEWGADCDNNMELADRAFHTVVGDPEVAKMMVDLGLGRHTNFVKSMFELSKVIGPDKLVAGTPTEVIGTKTYTREELRQMMADPRYNTDPDFAAKIDAIYKKQFKGQVVAATTGRGQPPVGTTIE